MVAFSLPSLRGAIGYRGGSVSRMLAIHERRRGMSERCLNMKIERPFLGAEPPSTWEVGTWCNLLKGHDGPHERSASQWPA